MKKSLCAAALVFLCMLAGCGSETPSLFNASSQPDTVAANISFMRGMGCSDPSCTDASHHHDCPADCADYNHYHHCALDCAEAGHHHAQTHHQEEHQANASGVLTTAFVSGMGCSDPSCTDASHHHDCPADCADYNHYHHCDLDCAEASHHHGGQTGSGGHGKHHNDRHH